MAIYLGFLLPKSSSGISGLAAGHSLASDRVYRAMPSLAGESRRRAYPLRLTFHLSLLPVFRGITLGLHYTPKTGKR